MGKRPAAPVTESSHTSFAKRQKLDGSVGRSPAKTEIQSARQLQQLLSFHQDAGSQLKQGIQSLKGFLESIAHENDEPAKLRRQAILKDYLDLQIARDDGEAESVYIPDVIQTWGYASQSNNESLLSAVPAVLALLLKTISALIDFRENGLRLCRTLLQRNQLKLISRGLSAPKSKEHLISPCLRLLSEVVSFDGGAQAKHLYALRDFTFNGKTLARNLGIRRASPGDPVEDRRKPSVRYNAIRYLLANFKFQDQASKSDILSISPITKALFEDLREDSPEIITEVLEAVKKHILLDEKLQRSSKSRFLTERTLSRIATLYNYNQALEESQLQHKSIDIVAHEFLSLVCTSSKFGVLISRSAWYPPGTEKDLDENEDGNMDHINVGLDSLQWYNRYHETVPVRNNILSNFIQSLRPYASTLQCELLLEIFKAAPELVADYFFKKKGFTLDPKLTATWIGYSAFLFSTVQLPVPQLLFGADNSRKAPPPNSIIIESVCPQPLDQKTLTKCLNQKSDLITFFAIRLITVAFEKLQAVLKLLRSQSNRPSNLWDEGASRLVTEFCRRCPKMKDIIAVFRNSPEDNVMRREAITRLLAMYYKIVPQIALEEKLDISVALTNGLSYAEKMEKPEEGNELRVLELEHLLDIGQRSPNMRWFNKPESLQFSPFIVLLKLCVNTPKGVSKLQLQELLHAITLENGVLQQETKPSSLAALLSSLETTKAASESAAVFGFLENCVGRLVRKPVSYSDQLDSVRDSAKVRKNSKKDLPVSLLILALNEQLEFVAKKESTDGTTIATWLARYLGYSKQIGEDSAVLKVIRDAMISVFPQKGYQSILKKAFKHEDANLVPSSKPSADEISTDGAPKSQRTPRTGDEPVDDTTEMIEMMESPPAEDENHRGLNRWTQKDVQEAVEDNDVGQLIICLCSKHFDIRKQALANVQRLMEKLTTSTYEEWQQAYLLLGEVSETAKDIITADQLPYSTGTFAARALLVLTNPLHPLYPKLNRFLNKGPSWNVRRLISYWTEKVLLTPPDHDDAHYAEVDWLLDTMIDGLRTQQDMEIYRICQIFERLLTLYSSHFLSTALRKKIIHLLFRATAVEGSTTLITRTGIISWIETRLAAKDPNDVTLKRLAKRLYETCDQTRVDEWSGGSIKEVLASIDGY
ncbi:MAG: hypothetical protein M1819_001183 [Sarea resinae]|nr:MAG: hypothetical protein M1819_001183 [Sarea resinae]